MKEVFYWVIQKIPEYKTDEPLYFCNKHGSSKNRYARDINLAAAFFAPRLANLTRHQKQISKFTKTIKVSRTTTEIK